MGFSERPMSLNTPTYVLTATSSSSAVTLTEGDINQRSLSIYNAGSQAVFLVSGVTAPTAVIPASATVPLQGKIVPPGAVVTYTKPLEHKFISGIAASGSNTVYISVGSGE